MKRRLRALIPANLQRGQSLVELAISLTVMLLLLSGAVTFGMALFSYVAIRDAAQEGALYASFNPYLDNNPADGKIETAEKTNANMTKICDRVKNSSTNPVNLGAFPACTNDGANNHAGTTPGAGNIDIISIATDGTSVVSPTYYCEGSTAVSGQNYPNAVKVTVEYNFPIFMPFIGGNYIHLVAEVTDTILEPQCPS